MTSGIAHDFNNALTQVLGFSELLLTRPEELSDPGKVREYLELMHTAAEDAASMVSRLRDFGREPVAGGPCEQLDLSELAEEVVALTRPRWKDQAQAGGRTIRVETELPPVPAVSGRRAELREVLTNLIFNAVDAMPAGGTITLRSRLVDGQVVLEIGDTGIGMTDEVRQRCLEPFFTTKGAAGTGLGLAVSHAVVRRFGGRMTLQSVAGAGTTVRICLPVAAGGAAPEVTPTVSEVSPAPLRVLVVDDERPIRQLLVELLGADGHTVEMAADGREALEKFRAGRFDLVVTDRAMPWMSGDEVAAAIRQLTPNAAIIMLTGFGEQMKGDGVRPVGVDLVLSKPVGREALRQAVASVSAPAAATAEEPAALPASSRAVLVIDDDDWIRDLLAAVLQAEGYDVIVARDGLEALARLDDRLPDLILLDMMMPRMDGFAFAEELRRRGLRSVIPIVVMSAADHTRQKTLLLGPAGFVRKPFDMAELLDTVAHAAA